jgi:VWFA-related protein
LLLRNRRSAPFQIGFTGGRADSFSVLLLQMSKAESILWKYTEKAMRVIYALLCLMILTLPINLRAQTSAPDKIRKGNKTLINVPVVVSDREGRYVSGLKKEDFVLYENGVEQNIASFSTYDEPVNVALLIDTSGSTKESLKEIKDAARDFIDLLNPNDKCLVATFAAQVNVLNSLTSDHKTLVSSLEKVRTAEKEGTVLLRAIEQVAQNSFDNVQGRKVIVLLSDGKDFGSFMTKNELLSRLEETDVSIYSIFYQTGAGFNKLTIEPDGTVKEAKEGKNSEEKTKEKKPAKKKKNYSILIPLRGDVFTEQEAKLISKAADIEAVNSLREMSDITAGRFYQSDAPNLSGIFKKIAGELRQQYQLGYHSKGAETDASVNEITVKVKRPDAVVRARGKFRAKQL